MRWSLQRWMRCLILTDLELVRKHVSHLNPDMKIFPVSAKTGEGMEALEQWLLEQAASLRKNKHA